MRSSFRRYLHIYFTSNIATQSTLVCEQLCIEDERDTDQIYFLGAETSNGDESHIGLK